MSNISFGQQNEVYPYPIVELDLEKEAAPTGSVSGSGFPYRHNAFLELKSESVRDLPDLWKSRHHSQFRSLTRLSTSLRLEQTRRHVTDVAEELSAIVGSKLSSWNPRESSHEEIFLGRNADS